MKLGGGGVVCEGGIDIFWNYTLLAYNAKMTLFNADSKFFKSEVIPYPVWISSCWREPLLFPFPASSTGDCQV